MADGLIMFYWKQNQFNSSSTYLLSLFQNFLGNVITITSYYDRFLASNQIHDVNSMAYYLGTIMELVLNFDQIDFDASSDPDLNWNSSYTPYRPPNQQNFSSPDPNDFVPPDSPPRIVVRSPRVEAKILDLALYQ